MLRWLDYQQSTLNSQPTHASVVKLLSSSASNGEFAGGSPAGCTNARRVSPTTRDAPLRTERLGVEIPHAAPAFASSFGSAGHFAHVVQCRDGALKTRTVSVQIRPWAPTACSPTSRGAPFKTGRLQVRLLPRGPFHGMPTGQANRASVLTNACLRASGASPPHSAIFCARSSKRTVSLIN